MAEPQRIAGRYEVLEARAMGMREELRARDTVLGREVLLVRPIASAPPVLKSAGERELREARALAALHHPGIQQLFEAFEDGGRLTLSLDPVAGETLAQRLERDGRLDAEEVRRIAIELADALAALHAASAVHRDVSARNIVLRVDGRACLVGFRFAKPIDLGVQSSIVYADLIRGPDSSDVRQDLPEHPAPEQFLGEAANPRSDLFALGCVLYRALTGQDAFPGRATSGSSPTQEPPRFAPATPRALSRAITACLARSPIGRPQSAAELRELLRAEVIKSSGAVAPGGRSRVVRVAALAAIALVAGGAAWVFRPRTPAEAGPRGLGVTEPNLSPTGAGAQYKAGFGRSRALLIGIGEAYRKNGFAPLANAVKDVLAVAEALKALPKDRWEEPTILVDEQATFDGIKTALAELEESLEPEDRALVYFAGHGIAHKRSDASGWLIPADGRQDTVDPGHTRWIEFVALDRFLADVPAKHVLLALDCCYGGRLASSRSAGARAFEERFLTRRAHVVLTSGRGDEQVSDGQRGHSPFAEIFVASLEPGGGPITSSELYIAMLREFNVRDLAQTPQLRSPEDSNGEFVFFRE